MPSHGNHLHLYAGKKLLVSVDGKGKATELSDAENDVDDRRDRFVFVLNTAIE